MRQQALARGIAFLLMAYALDVAVWLIDVFALPLPRYVASTSFSAVFLLAALPLLVPLARLDRAPLVRPFELGVLATLTLWVGLEAMAGLRGGKMGFDLILEFIPLLLALMAFRLHFEIFRSRGVLVSTFVLAASTLVAVHTALLVAAALHLPLPMVNPTELAGRNALAHLVPVCLWLLAFFPHQDWPLFGRRYNLLLILGLLSIWLTSTRSAVLVMAWCVLLGALMRFPTWKHRVNAALLPAGLLIVLAAALAYPIATGVGGQLVFLAGEGDNAMSFWSRARTNFMLLEKLAEDPVLGIGWPEVAATRVFGYMGHTLYINVIAAFGIAGAVPAVVLGRGWLAGLHGQQREAASHLIFLALLISSVFNNVFAYFALPLVLIRAARPQYSFQRSHEQPALTPHRT